MKESFTIAVAGNPNVGKSTLFNALTGLKQHTGNWAGKTVENAVGSFETDKYHYDLVDIPGTYSLYAHSKEEEIARNYICFDKPQLIIAVCDATCLERNLNLVLQITEIHKRVILCVNLMDEAKKKGIKIDLEELSNNLGIPVVGCVARDKRNIKALSKKIDEVIKEKITVSSNVKYPKVLEESLERVGGCLEKVLPATFNHRWVALQLLLDDKEIIGQIERKYDFNIESEFEIKSLIEEEKARIHNEGCENINDMVAVATVLKAEEICKKSVNASEIYNKKDRKLDKLFTGKHSGYLIMIALLCFCLWITVSGANYFSEILSQGFAVSEKLLVKFFGVIGLDKHTQRIIIEGFWRVPAWVVAVMLPPMAIFFPLFTLLEDFGYLPRVAFNLDKPFKRCKSCGKQALTMCMGLGCNAAGVTGCRIIDSKREKLLAILTNSFMPCNGKFPTIIAIVSVFFISTAGIASGLLSAFSLCLVIVLGVLMTFLATKLLSLTFLRGTTSAYTLELPPYRRPQFGKVIVRSIFDRTIFVLGRSVLVAIPAGFVIFLFANISVNNVSLLSFIAEFLNPLGKLMGLDGMILIAFILGFPANEIVMPIALMGYLSGNSLSDLPGLMQMKEILVSNGWTVNTAVCVILFSLLHWPCSTTVLTIKKETGSFKWAAVAILLPTIFGFLLCVAVTLCFKFAAVLR